MAVAEVSERQGGLSVDDLRMTIEDMISTLDGAAGRLIVPALYDPVVAEAKEMIMAVSLTLGEIAMDLEA